MNADHSYEGTGAEDGKYLIVCTMGTEWWMGNDGARDERVRSDCSILLVRRMGGNGAFVWCSQRKVYRLSENTL